MGTKRKKEKQRINKHQNKGHESWSGNIQPPLTSKPAHKHGSITDERRLRVAAMQFRIKKTYRIFKRRTPYSFLQQYNCIVRGGLYLVRARLPPKVEMAWNTMNTTKNTKRLWPDRGTYSGLQMIYQSHSHSHIKWKDGHDHEHELLTTNKCNYGVSYQAFETICLGNEQPAQLPKPKKRKKEEKNNMQGHTDLWRSRDHCGLCGASNWMQRRGVLEEGRLQTTADDLHDLFFVLFSGWILRERILYFWRTRGLRRTKYGKVRRQVVKSNGRERVKYYVNKPKKRSIYLMRNINRNKQKKGRRWQRKQRSWRGDAWETYLSREDALQRRKKEEEKDPNKQKEKNQRGQMPKGRDRRTVPHDSQTSNGPPGRQNASVKASTMKTPSTRKKKQYWGAVSKLLSEHESLAVLVFFFSGRYAGVS